MAHRVAWFGIAGTLLCAACGQHPPPRRYEPCVMEFTAPQTLPGDEPLGQPRPTAALEHSTEHGWAVLAQAFGDTDGNGEVALVFEHHGAPLGDRRHAVYFDARNSDGARSEALLDVSPARTLLAFESDGEAFVVDTRTDAHWTLGLLAELPDYIRERKRGRRDDVRFVDERRVVMWTGSQRLELIDFRLNEHTVLLDQPGWLATLTFRAGWVVVDLMDAPPPATLEEEYRRDEALYAAYVREHGTRAFTATTRESRIWARGGIEPRANQRWAVHVATGVRVSAAGSALWPAAWGLVRLSADGRLVVATLDGTEVVAATDCFGEVLVVPGVVQPGVAHECGRNGVWWVGVQGAPLEVRTVVHDPSQIRTVEEARALVGQTTVWAFRPDGTYFETSEGDYAQGENVMVDPENARAWSITSAPGYAALNVDRRPAPNGFSYVDTVASSTGAFFRVDDVWRSASAPREERACVHADYLARELWGRCIHLPSRMAQS
ncbi:MAG: hypothetical protein H6726_01085 [Sandaracinaceae bacterium]|nr:hypothetical protein [Sandaracinaceae bacterium]